jgi:hypothetical protein
MTKLLSAAQVGERLGVQAKTARKYIRQMTTVVLPGGDIRVEEAELEQWISGKRQAPENTNIFKQASRVRREVRPDLFEADGRIKRRRHPPK